MPRADIAQEGCKKPQLADRHFSEGNIDGELCAVSVQSGRVNPAPVERLHRTFDVTRKTAGVCRAQRLWLQFFNRFTDQLRGVVAKHLQYGRVGKHHMAAFVQNHNHIAGRLKNGIAKFLA